MSAATQPSLPIVLVPGLLCTARLYVEQLPALWRFGPVIVADHTRDSSVSAIAHRILTQVQGPFALVGLSMGGYVAFEVWRQASERVAKLALLDTTARPDAPEQSEARQRQIDIAKSGRFDTIADLLFPKFVAAARHGDEALRTTVRTMARDVGADAFVRQQTAIMHRPDSRPNLPAIRCPALVLVGEDDTLTPPDRAQEIAANVQDPHLVKVPRCGHLSTIEQPEAVTRALVEFLDA
ncbi:MAG TPA: alpha/beta fold hydrolase [Gammaproteobacteria bacterium]|nr:alpha/beta fold hydrolase [Gammaproteobacteria bacterium]